MSGLTDLDAILASLVPMVQADAAVYATVDAQAAASLPTLATIREEEGTTVVLRRADADAAGLSYDLVLAWITLNVHTALEGVGLTAAFSRALADAGIPCNVLAGYFHDHILVPEELADDALTALRALRHAR
jgi:hypothetical protein